MNIGEIRELIGKTGKAGIFRLGDYLQLRVTNTHITIKELQSDKATVILGSGGCINCLTSASHFAKKWPSSNHKDSSPTGKSSTRSSFKEMGLDDNEAKNLWAVLGELFPEIKGKINENKRRNS